MKVVAHHSFPTEKANNRMKYSVIGLFFLFVHTTTRYSIQRQPKRGQGSFLWCWLFFHGMTQRHPHKIFIFYPTTTKDNNGTRRREKEANIPVASFLIISSVLSLSLSLTHTHLPSPTPTRLSRSLSGSFNSKQTFLIEERMTVE